MQGGPVTIRLGLSVSAFSLVNFPLLALTFGANIPTSCAFKGAPAP